MPILQTPAAQALLHKYVGSQVPGAGIPMASPEMLAIPGTTEGSLEYQLGAKIPQLLQGKQTLAPVGDWIDNAEGNPLRSGMFGTLAGAAGGAGLGVLLGKDPQTSALLGGAGLGGASWLIGTLLNMQRKRLREKQMGKHASFYGNSSADPASYVSSRIALDSSLGFTEKTQLSGLVDKLSDGQTQELAKLLRAAGGAAIGALVAKYMLRLGLTGTVLSAILGGAIGSAWGNKSIDRDVFGNARLIQ